MFYDLLVIGGGSGGIAAARRAASIYGAKVALIESSNLGGTCVNLGCVPKKIMYNAATISDMFRESSGYGFSDVEPSLNWRELVEKRNSYIKKLNNIYESNLKKDGIRVINGVAKFISKNCVSVSTNGDLNNSAEEKINAHKIIIATGSRAVIPDNVPGHGLGITSDGFFSLTSLPKKVGIIGSGYVGVELAGILHSLGSDVTLWCRKEGVLSHFDGMIGKTLTDEMRRVGIQINNMSNVLEVKKSENILTVCFEQENQRKECFGYDTLIWAIGRTPNTGDLGLKEVGLKLDKSEHLIVDEFQNTNVDGIYAIGDVTGKVPLTPVAIAAGRRLIDRILGGKSSSKLDYNNIPTVVFSHPSPCGMIGLSESQARSDYSNVRTYESSFTNLYYSMLQNKSITRYKLVCEGEDERIVGLHIIGKGSDEILQGFAVALKMGARKKDFDSCVAIHPTAAEELVTMR